MFRTHSCYHLLAGALLAGSLTAAPAPPSAPEVRQLLDSIPLFFEANEGQADPEVRFLSRAARHTVFLTGTEAVISTPGGALRMSLTDSNPAPEVEGVEAMESRSGYFLGNRPEDWRPSVQHFGKVRYNEVFDGIDLVYYGQGKRLEHDFVIRPGADPNDIRFKLEGAEAIQIAPDGALAIKVGESELRFSAPVSYVQGAEPVEVASRFVRTGQNEFGFEVGSYDRSKTLVIDPVLIYSSYFGGSAHDIARDVAVDASGHIIVVGETVSEDYPTNGPPLQDGGGDEINGFVLKLDPFAGAGRGLVFSGYYGGVQDEDVAEVEIDAAGNIYIVGSTASGDFPVTDNAVQNERPSITTNGYLVKFNLDADPLLQYGTYLGGEGRDEVYALAIENPGRAYMTGYSAGGGFPLSSTPMQSSERGGGDAFFTIVDTVGGGLIYSSYLGGTTTDRGSDVVVERDGVAYITGFTASGDYPIKGGSYQTGHRGRGDAFLTQINWRNSGLQGLGYSTYFGGTDLDVGSRLLKDSDGVYHVIGYTLSENFPTTAAAPQRANAGNSDVFLATLDTTKPGGEALRYSTYFGGEAGDVPYGVEVDSAGGFVFAGYTISDDLPIVGDYLDNEYNKFTDVFFARIDPAVPNGEGLTCSSFLGGSLLDVAWGMTLDSLDNLYLVGETWSLDFPVTDNAFLGKKPGIISSFVVKIGPCATPGETGGSGDARRRSSDSGESRSSRGGGRGR